MRSELQWFCAEELKQGAAATPRRAEKGYVCQEQRVRYSTLRPSKIPSFIWDFHACDKPHVVTNLNDRPTPDYSS